MLKGKWLLIIIIVLVFSGGRMALADGDHHKVPSTSNLNGNTDQNMEGMDMSGSDNNSHDMEGMDMEESGHSHGPVKETPPNAKVLGTFGAVNASFILIGIWNKWLRRKGDTNGNSK